FSLSDYRHYGPEFASTVEVVWLAVAKSSAWVGHSRNMDFPAFISQELGTQRWQEIARNLAGQGKSIDDYQLMPVHPW
ncbi:IucA/IucC family protein, partial [Pseudomonas syringae pv. tagetis]|uniref:IucA/IucC family protein n=1 Tax=Pseudomonas syringae group genomosp. 7 TaxID=251699 RepID=UPI0037700F23